MLLGREIALLGLKRDTDELTHQPLHPQCGNGQQQIALGESDHQHPSVFWRGNQHEGQIGSPSSWWYWDATLSLQRISSDLQRQLRIHNKGAFLYLSSTPTSPIIYQPFAYRTNRQLT